MKILFLGEYSNVHATLAKGLRALGHTVTVASDGDVWKNYPRDIDLARHSTGLRDSLSFFLRLARALPRLRGYDVVQLINPVFLPLKPQRIWPLYKMIAAHNGACFLGAFGMDTYYVRACFDGHTFRYSDFFLGTKRRRMPCTDEFERDWGEHGDKTKINLPIAQQARGIVAGLYEYYAAYAPHFPQKTRFIPFPIDLSHTPFLQRGGKRRITFFIGIQHKRSDYKGTDVMLRALERIVSEYPDRCAMRKAESVPFAEYCQMLNESDVILDQLYSYTPGMNALEAMARGMVVVGGAEPENYDILEERTLRPIVNVQPNEESVYEALRDLVMHPERVAELSRQSRQYIVRHHECQKVAARYLSFWKEQGASAS